MSDDGLEYSEVAHLATRIGKIPEQFQARTRRELRRLGQGMLADARSNAAWSTRIPGALQLRVSLNSRRPGITLRASLKAAPHARVYEGFLGPTFNHPLFGDRNTWYTQAARPYAQPAVQKAGLDLVAAISDVVDQIHREAGLA